MIDCSDALKAYLRKSRQPACTAWLSKKKNGEVIGFTEHSFDFSFNLEAWMVSRGLGIIPAVLGTGLVRYRAASGHSRTDIATSAALDVDNLQASGPLRLPSLVRADVRAGLWDACKFTLFLINPDDLTMGALIYRVGKLGEITISRNTFTADLLGVTVAYAKLLGQFTSPICRYTLGDSNCKVDLTGSGGGSPSHQFTVNSTLSGVELAARPRVLYDVARTEPGPVSGAAIIGITKANPGVVTLDGPLAIPDGGLVVIDGVLGMLEVNTTTTYNNPVGNTFQLSVDTTNFDAYIGGGTVTPFGGISGWFAGGVFTFNSGLNAGISMEIQEYTPGIFILELPMPYEIVGDESYTAVVGCMKAKFQDCRDKFNNLVNFGGEPDTPGMDKLLAIGRQG